MRYNSINYGIKTGCNDAFIIDNETKEALIGRDSRSAEIIRPLLRGRDISRYKTQRTGLWLIDVHNGYEDVTPVDIYDYEAIKNHLDQFYTCLKKRKDQGITPYNLRNCAYHTEFKKEKIVWKRIGSKLRFSYCGESLLCLDSTCIATGKKLLFLTAILNSRVIHYQLFSRSPKTGTGDLIVSVQAVEPLFVPVPSRIQEKEIVDLIKLILDDETLNSNANISVIKKKIDQLVYQLYGFTQKEIVFIEKQLSMY